MIISENRLDTLIRFLAFLIIFSFLLPVFKVGGFGMKPDLPILFPLLFLVLMTDKKVKSLNLFRKISIITFLLFFNMLLSGTFGLNYFNQNSRIYFPTEFIQIFSRVSVFYCFFYIAYNQVIVFNSFKKQLNLIFIVALLFGFFQSINLPFIKEISNLYVLTDTQARVFDSVNQRGFGVAGNVLTWGGLSGFVFYYFYFLSENKLIKLIGCCLALINVSFSVSRSALISLGVSFVLINLIVALFVKKDLIAFFKVFLTVVLTVFTVIYSFVSFFPSRYELILMRFSYMDDALYESGRGAQREFFIKLMNSDYLNYFIGIGKPVLDGLGYMEMEPLFLLVAYGIVGVILHYLLIFVSLKKAFEIKYRDEKMFAFIGGTTIFYLIFSFGFFFMREIYSGMIFWIVMGYFIGNIYLRKREFNS